MGIEISFSFMRGVNAQDALPDLLKEFEKLYGIKVNLIELTWGSAWSELTQYALRSSGPDVSQIGSSWLSGLISMNTLAPFSPYEQNRVGGESIFIPEAWRGVVYNGNPYAMPWFSESRLLYYRRDLLEKAGLNEEQAFASLETLENTIQVLRSQGVRNPWAVQTGRNPNNVHLISSWVWAHGGDYMSADGKMVVFDRPEAIKGVASYFKLTQFMDDRMPDMLDHHLRHMFFHGDIAIMPSGPWMEVQTLSQDSVLKDAWGVAPLPGIPFVGGSHLVVWKHSRRREQAVQLMEYLCSENVQAQLFRPEGLIPANRQTIEAHIHAKDPILAACFQSILRGRSYPLVPLWTKVEDRLVAEFNGIWADILTNHQENFDNQKVEEMIHARLTSQARRLNLAVRGW